MLVNNPVISGTLQRDTAVTLQVGPFIDEDDGKTTEQALVIAQANIRISKAGGLYAQSAHAGGATHDEDGWYRLTLAAGDTDTPRILTLAIHMAGALPVWRHYWVE